ncbi:MAG: peptidoglycan DD-metalloendopeptidase family protein [Nitrospirae bacterium]|nr:peptidoglycan DD-metalloendopeptidase family protein [Nitrospirota bacterium]
MRPVNVEVPIHPLADAGTSSLTPRAGLDGLNPKDPAAVQRVAREFEAMFLGILMRSMRATVPKSGLFGEGKGAEMFRSLWDEQMAHLTTNGEGLGLADLLARSIGGPGGDEGAGGSPFPGIVRRRIAERYKALESKAHEGHGGFEGHEKEERMANSPAPGVVSSRYGNRKDPFTGEVRFHRGVDIAAPEGSPVAPIMPGKVVFSGEKGGYGNVVVVQHDDGYVTTYAHNAKNMAKVGDVVDQTTVIAVVGKTGRATGPHLHFEIARNGRTVDPGRFVEVG